MDKKLIREGNFVRKSINKYLVEKRGYPLEKKSGKRCFKKSENFEWQPQALLPGQYSFFPVGHLISFSELRTPPAVSGTMAKIDHIGRIGKTRLKRLLFLRCHWLVSSTF